MSLLAVVCGACGSDLASPTATTDALPSVAPLPTDPALDDSMALVDPLTLWFTDGHSYGELDSLEDAAVAACMSEAGLTWVAPQRGPSTPVTRGALREFRHTYGYGLFTVTGGTTAANDPNRALMDGLSEDDLLAYLDVLEGPVEGGDRNGGCRATAHDAVFSTVEARTHDDRAIEISNAALSDPRLAAAREHWAVCMSEAGYPDIAGASDPVAAVATVGAATDSPAEYELAVAKADVLCAASTIWEAQLVVGNEAVAALDG